MQQENQNSSFLLNKSLRPGCSIAGKTSVWLILLWLQLLRWHSMRIMYNKYQWVPEASLEVAGVLLSAIRLGAIRVASPSKAALVCQWSWWCENWQRSPQVQKPFCRKLLHFFLRKAETAGRLTSSWGPWAKRHLRAQGQRPVSEKFLQSSVLCLRGLVLGWHSSSSLSSQALSPSVESQEPRSQDLLCTFTLICLFKLQLKLRLGFVAQAVLPNASQLVICAGGNQSGPEQPGRSRLRQLGLQTPNGSNASLGEFKFKCYFIYIDHFPLILYYGQAYLADNPIYRKASLCPMLQRLLSRTECSNPVNPKLLNALSL